MQSLSTKYQNAVIEGCTTINSLLMMQTPPLLRRSYCSIMNIFWPLTGCVIKMTYF